MSPAARVTSRRAAHTQPPCRGGQKLGGGGEKQRIKVHVPAPSSAAQFAAQSACEATSWRSARTPAAMWSVGAFTSVFDAPLSGRVSGSRGGAGLSLALYQLPSLMLVAPKRLGRTDHIDCSFGGAV